MNLSYAWVYGGDAFEVQELLLIAQNSDPTFVEAVWILLGGDVKIDGEDEVRPGEVQVHGQSHLHRDKDINLAAEAI